jgi:hypothetical protein
VKRLSTLTYLLAILVPVLAPAADLTLPPLVLRDAGDSGELEPRKLILPYLFATETLGVAGGVGAGASAWPSEQASLFGIVMGTSNSSWATYLVGTSMKLPGARRWFLDSSVSVGWFTEQRLYVDGNPDFPEGGSGSNDSDPENYVEGEGWHNWLTLNFKYVLPTGTRRAEAIESFALDAGIPVAGSPRPGRWNPARSGTTLLQLEPFIFYRTIEPETGRQQGYTGGLGVSVLYDNRDFSPNPSRGSATSLGVAGGAGLDDVSRSWASLRGKYSKYLSLGETRRLRQQVLAFNAWTAYTPTWDQDEEVQEIFDRVPPQMGASLGGFLRLRGFPLYRFQDKAAIYYGAEYRVIPRWNPLGQISWLRWLQIDWWQFVPFVELGRVAPSWDLQELHSDLKWDAGLGLRLMTAKVVVRGDVAYSEEGWHFWAMVGQAF